MSPTTPDAGSDERLAGAIRQLARDEEPSPGWQAEVMASIDRQEQPWWRRWQVLALGFSGAAVALVVVIAIVEGMKHEPSSPASAEQLILKGGAVLRGGEAHVGDTLRVRVQPGRDRHVELQAWRTERNVLIARCATGGEGVARCVEIKGAFVLDVPLGETGRHRVVVLSSAQALPSGGAAAVLEHVVGDASVEVRWLEPIDVR